MQEHTVSKGNGPFQGLHAKLIPYPAGGQDPECIQGPVAALLWTWLPAESSLGLSVSDSGILLA